MAKKGLEKPANIAKIVKAAIPSNKYCKKKIDLEREKAKKGNSFHIARQILVIFIDFCEICGLLVVLLGML